MLPPMPEAPAIALHGTALLPLALAALGGALCAQDPGAADPPAGGAAHAFVERLAEHLVRCERATYGGRTATTSVTLVGADPQALRGTSWSDFEPILTEFARARPDAAPPPPVAVGHIAYASGAWTFCVDNRAFGPAARTVACSDGRRTLQLRTSGHATLWERTTECDVRGLVWNVLKLGDRSLAPLMLKAAKDGSLSARLEAGPPATLHAAFPAPLLGVPFRVALTAELRGESGQLAVTQLEIHRGDRRASLCEISGHREADGVLLPARFTLTTELPGTDGLALAQAIAVDYGDPGPDPAAILALAATSFRIATLRTDLLPVAGMDRAMAAAAAGDANPAAIPLAPERRTAAHGAWPDLAAWIAAEQRERRFLTREQADGDFALPIAAAMCARWAGKELRLQDLLAAPVRPPCALEEAALWLQAVGLDYAAVETPLAALAACEEPFVVTLEHTAARAMRIAAGRRLVWQPARGLEREPPDATDAGIARALVARTDLSRIGRRAPDGARR